MSPLRKEGQAELPDDRMITISDFVEILEVDHTSVTGAITRGNIPTVSDPTRRPRHSPTRRLRVDQVGPLIDALKDAGKVVGKSYHPWAQTIDTTGDQFEWRTPRTPTRVVFTRTGKR